MFAKYQFYTDEATGRDDNGDGSAGNPYATVQKAIDFAVPLLTGRTTVEIVVTGDVTTSSRNLLDMDRAALIYIDGMKIGRRTDAPGSSGMTGGLIIDLSAATLKPGELHLSVSWRKLVGISRRLTLQ